MEDLRQFVAGRRILVICPKYFSYHEIIISRLKELGANIAWIDGRLGSSLLSKILLRYIPYLYNKKIFEYFRMSIQEQYDCILVVSPEYLTGKHVLFLKNIAKASQIILYMWDTLANKKLPPDAIQYFDRKLTFDKNDALKYNMIFRPLFFCSGKSINKTEADNTGESIDVSFIGTGHSDRAKIVMSIKKQCVEFGLSFYFYLYLPNRLVYLFNKLTNKNFLGISNSYFCYEPISYNDYIIKMEASKVILDVEHPRQTGLTMRTLEVLGKEKKLITTNQEIKHYDFYLEDNILVIDRSAPRIDANFIKRKYTPIDTDVFWKYSIDGWLETVFS